MHVGRTWDRLIALILLGLAVYTIKTAQGLGYLQGRVPGPGFAPFWIGVGLVIAALVVLLGTWADSEPARDRAGRETSMVKRSVTVTLLATAAVTVAAVALIGTLGLLTAISLMLLVQVRIFGGPWRAAVLTAIALPLAFHVLFARWFKVPLPPGPWGF